MALDEALDDIYKGNVGSIPDHIKTNSPLYKYPHDYKGSYVVQQYLPDRIKNKEYYNPKSIGYEVNFKQVYDRLKKINKETK